MDEKKRIFSGVQPTGNLTIGNYLGAIRNWTKMQEDYDCIYCAVDMHAITIKREPKDLRRQTLELLALYIACGIDEEKSTLFIQSHVPAHAELTWVLNTMTYIGELSRMTQFKDKSKNQSENSINMGLMDYPVLMASDILLYQTDVVPVGVDQKQHLELARDLAIRFNNRYSDTFVVPEPYIVPSVAKIMALDDPTKKMSKSSDNPNSHILMTDTPEDIRRKLKRAVTDSDNQIRLGEDKPAISNLLFIYAAFEEIDVKEAENRFKNSSYAEFKSEVAESIIRQLEPIQKRQAEILKDKKHLDDVLRQGAEKANYLARKTLSKVYRKIGFYSFDKK